MIKLLVLSAGTNASYHFSKVITENYQSDYCIVGADINDRHLIPTCVYLDAYYKVPYSNHPDYYAEILKICDLEKIDFIIPSYDADQKLFYPENPDLLARNVTSLSTSRDTLEIYRDKEIMHSFLSRNNFPVPRQYLPSDVRHDAEYFIKPRDGVASRGARKVKGDALPSNIEDFVIQEICSEPEYTLECFHYKHAFSSVVRERIATRAGVCVKTKIYHDPRLENIAREFAGKVKAPLYFNLQFMKNEAGEPVITDVNLRLAGGMSLSHAAGWDEASAMAEVMKGEDVDKVFSHLKLNAPIQYVIRAYTDIITSRKQGVIAVDLDGTLLDSTPRHQVVMDAVLRDFGLSVDTQQLVPFKAGGNNNIAFLEANGVNSDTARAIQARWIELIEDEQYLALDVLYADAVEFLQKLSGKYDLLLVTARKNHKGTVEQIKALGLGSYFAKIFIVPDARHKAGILAENNASMMIGDTEADWSAAQNAGIDFKMLNRGFRNASFWDAKEVPSYHSLFEIKL